MPLLMVRNDITKMEVDAVVNPSNRGLRQGSGTSRAIFLGAGEEALTRACRSLGGCEEGKAVITEGFGLPARYIIHAVCPRWWGGMRGEAETLASAYRSALAVAKAHQLETVAFPLLSTGFYGYPKKDAVKIAVAAIGSFLMEEDMTVYLVFYDSDSTAIGRKLSAKIREYIDDHYIEEKDKALGARSAEKRPMPRPDQPTQTASFSAPAPAPPMAPQSTMPMPPPMAPQSAMFAPPPMAPQPAMASPLPFHNVRDRRLEDLLENMNETFSQMLLRLIDERGLKDPVVYRKANIDRRLFSKIRKDAHYAPTKKTVLAFAIALELSLDEARDLLMKAGYAFSNSSQSDIIISYFIENRRYDIFEINEVLFAYQQPILGE